MAQPNAQQDVVLLDNISLTNLGAYMLFEDIHEDSSLRLCDYLLKANMILDPNDALTLFINSPGGSVTDGWAIIDVMESSRIAIQTVAMGCIASMAVPIFVAGTKGMRIMTPRTAVMTHQFSTAFWGKQHELIAARKFHDTLEQQFIDHFVKHTKMNEKQVRDILLRPSDTWLSPQECLKYGICDVIRDPWDTEEEAVAKVKAAKKKPAPEKEPVPKLPRRVKTGSTGPA
jgi:ATP-dependent Clp protease protease subunit